MHKSAATLRTAPVYLGGFLVASMGHQADTSQVLCMLSNLTQTPVWTPWVNAGWYKCQQKWKIKIISNRFVSAYLFLCWPWVYHKLQGHASGKCGSASEPMLHDCYCTMTVLVPVTLLTVFVCETPLSTARNLQLTDQSVDAWYIYVDFSSD